MNKIYLIITALLLLVIILGSTVFILTKQTTTGPKQNDLKSYFFKKGASNNNFILLPELTPFIINADWQQPEIDQIVIDGKTISGKSQKGRFISRTAAVKFIASDDQLIKLGWKLNKNLQAGGPSSGSWGYMIDNKGKKQVIEFFWDNRSFVPPPAEIKCPCEMDVRIFLSDAF